LSKEGYDLRVSHFIGMHVFYKYSTLILCSEHKLTIDFLWFMIIILLTPPSGAKKTINQPKHTNQIINKKSGRLVLKKSITMTKKLKN
jgi:hypothetical protein